MRVLLLSLLLLLAVSLAEKERLSDGGAAARFRHHQAEHGDDHHADHQAILGSRKSADAFDELSAAESKRRLAVIARKMDKDGDGFISEQELADHVLASMISLDEEENEERFREMDTDGDAHISWQEYVADSFPDQNPDTLIPEDKKLITEDKMYFDAADVDKDGKLNREEAGAFLTPENHQHMHATLVQVTMWEKDTDKDGAISLKEFLGEMAENTQSEWHAVERERFASEYDEDKDGLLKGEEVRRWLIPDTRNVALQEAQHLIQQADKDKDGRLTVEEVVAEHGVFVGSEATNYGEDLHKVNHNEL